MAQVEPVQVCASVACGMPIAALQDEAVLTDDQRATASLPPRRIAERLAARVLLRRLLAEVVGDGAATSPLAARPGGQPYLIAHPEVGVSLSHSNGWVAAAVCPNGSVGVDVQIPSQAVRGLLRRSCSESVRSALAFLPQPARDVELAWIWSVQEACVKATGEGVAGKPWNVPVDVGQRRGKWEDVCWCALRDNWSVPVSTAHYIGVACQCTA